MYSPTVSLFSIHAFYGDLARGHVFARQLQPAAPWFTRRRLRPRDIAFRRNLETLVREVAADGAAVLLVPYRPTPHRERNDRDDDRLLAECAANEAILLDVARRYDATVAPFPATVISPDNWLDNCHLNAEGCREKAHHVAASILPLLSTRQQ